MSCKRKVMENGNKLHALLDAEKDGYGFYLKRSHSSAV